MIREEIKQVLEKQSLTIFDKHQKKIALSTLKMSAVGATIAGGMTKDEARAFLKKIGYSDAQIKKVEKQWIKDYK